MMTKDFFSPVYKNIGWLMLAFGLFVGDQASKHWALNYLDFGFPHQPFPIFIFILVYNPGIALGFLGDKGELGKWFLIIIAICVSIWLISWLVKITEQKKFLLKLALMCIVGGTLGNLYDRLTMGHVVDFITMAYNQFHWPTVFNFADVSITFGALLLVVDMLHKK